MLERTKEEEKEIIKKAKTTAEEMIKDAKEQIALDTVQAQTQLDKYVVKLSLELLKKSLGNVFTEKEQSEIIERAVKEMQKQPN